MVAWGKFFLHVITLFREVMIL